MGFAVQPAIMNTFTVAERLPGATRGRPTDPDGNRVLLASHDKDFLDHALAKLRGTSIHACVATDTNGILGEIARANPHAAIISDNLLEDDPALGQTLARRYPSLPVLVVGSEGRARGKQDWRIVSWGGVGLVPKEELLRGQVLAMVIRELAQMRSGGGSSPP
ncbi:hypothetical protein [Methylobacterium oryzae]|uniref:Response regulatory domain-containing protein n=1 Tax=Methylobacterium oryzae TaxID=334852 RepID=A0ABU7TR44_9HYPH